MLLNYYPIAFDYNQTNQSSDSPESAYTQTHHVVHFT